MRISKDSRHRSNFRLLHSFSLFENPLDVHRNPFKEVKIFRINLLMCAASFPARNVKIVPHHLKCHFNC